ncbi:methyltransferase domain-containing protein [Solidesulfovibrio sp. C21]|uniref:methyltransferase domain-containing protein n=1 Tax=Solidesulfovibrio sp. C21 TaxID=3398613 RepID=UPI0039FC450D
MVAQDTPFEWQWQLSCSGPEAYERYIVPAWMGRWAEALVAAGAVGAGDRVLDVACGTGVVARKAARLVGPKGRLTGVDFNEDMVRAAKRFADQEGLSGIEWHCGDVLGLPGDKPEYDVVLCQQGVQFFPDRPAALKAMRAALVPGGRLVLSCWRAVARIPLFAVLADVLEGYFGPAMRAGFQASSSLSDREDLRALLQEAGFNDIRVRLEIQAARHPDLLELLAGYLSVFPSGTAIAAMSETDRAAMFRSMAEGLRDFQDDDGLAVPMESHVATAMR